MSERSGTGACPEPRVAIGAVLIEQRPDGPYVLLVKRAKPPYAGRWTVPGGRVEAGERLADAVAREVLEETGLVVRVGALVEVVEVIDDTFHYVILDYRCERVSGELRPGDDVESVQMLPVFDLVADACTPGLMRVVSRALTEDDERE